MLNTATLREIGNDGASRLVGAISDMTPAWKIRQRRARTRKLLWVVGGVVGFLLMIGLVWGLLSSIEGPEE